MAQSFEFADEQCWFVVGQPGAGVYAIREPLHEEDVRSWLIAGSDRALLIDTGMGVGNIRKIVDAITDLPVTVVNSHSHWDHIGGNWRFDDIAIHVEEADWLSDPEFTGKLRRACAPEHLRGPLPPGVARDALSIPASRAATLLSGGERFDLGDRTFEAIHLPGHAAGLLAFLDRNSGVLISTDVVYPGPLYAQFKDSDPLAYLASLDKLVSLIPDLKHVFPAHGGEDMAPEMIRSMRDAMAAVVEGREPDEVDNDKATHLFDGLAIYVQPQYRGSTQS